jgi:hypothetical protein
MYDFIMAYEESRTEVFSRVPSGLINEICSWAAARLVTGLCFA